MNSHSRQPDRPGKPLSVLIFGAGAIGTYIGGSLALHDHQVVFLERPEIAEEIRRRGLHLSMEGIDEHLPDPETAASLPEALSKGPFDAAVFALKSNDTQAALKMIEPVSIQMPPMLCLQNGVENEPALAAVLGEDRVIPGSVTSAIGRKAAGEIVLEKKPEPATHP